MIPIHTITKFAAAALAAAAIAPAVAGAASERPVPPKDARSAKVHHLPRHAHPQRRALARAADVRYADGHSFTVGARCDAGYRMFGTVSQTSLPSGQAYYLIWVYDYNTGSYVYASPNWIAGNAGGTWVQRARFSPMVKAAVYVKYARWTSSGWVYSAEWLNTFVQDDIAYSNSCTF